MMPGRTVGPRPPSRIGAVWRALVTGPAPVRLWAQILGFGTVIGVIVHTLHLFFRTINDRGTPIEIVVILANGVVWVALSLCFIALVEVVAITELKLGARFSKDGVHADLEHDDAPTTTVQTTVTVTPEARPPEAK